MAVDLGAGGPDRVRRVVTAGFYDLVALDGGQLSALRAEFEWECGRLAGADGRVPCGMWINCATARLLPADSDGGGDAGGAE
ncbi:hypothetical protein ACIQBJ_30345 [Kitasatospora sp. NPDC088391]|uniref:hypothetical protein n=1 Tax=Kitasatospora sp. NPDC088391 TaxID=3364074 RepID=UPI0037F91340